MKIKCKISGQPSVFTIGTRNDAIALLGLKNCKVVGEKDDNFFNGSVINIDILIQESIFLDSRFIDWFKQLQDAIRLKTTMSCNCDLVITRRDSTNEVSFELSTF